MPRKKPKSKDLKDEQVIRKLFPTKAVEAAKKEAKNPRSPAKTSIEDKSK